MKIATAFSTEKDTIQATSKVIEHLQAQIGIEPHIIFLHCSEGYDRHLVTQTVGQLSPGVPIHGGTSCLGVMTNLGFHAEDNLGIAALGIHDLEGAYGVAHRDLSIDPRIAALEAAKEALHRARRDGEVPDVVWITAAPGFEEEIILGISDFFGPNIPVFGGSSADNKVAGKWWQFSGNQSYVNSVVVAVLFTSKGVAFSFHNGYDATRHKGIVTRAKGRTIFELSGQPAAEVYSTWIGNKIESLQTENGSILQATTMHPLGRLIGTIRGVPYFQLSHPEKVTQDRALTLFTNISEGDEVFLMHGSRASLIRRAKHVAVSAIHSIEDDDLGIACALVVYCAGCMLAVRDEMKEVVNSLRDGLGIDVPFLGMFTFGEQGCFQRGENRHGNLMISVLLFLK